MEDCVIVQTNYVELEAIRLGKGAQLPEAVKTGLARRQEDSIDNKGGVTNRTKTVAIPV